MKYSVSILVLCIANIIFSQPQKESKSDLYQLKKSDTRHIADPNVLFTLHEHSGPGRQGASRVQALPNPYRKPQSQEYSSQITQKRTLSEVPLNSDTPQLPVLSVSKNLFTKNKQTDLFYQAPEQWQWLNPTPQGNDLNDIHVFNKDTAYAVGANGTFMKTFDGGQTWDIIHNAGGIKYDLWRLFFLNPDTGWVTIDITYESYGFGDDPPSILKTTDGGETWTGIIIDHHNYFFNPVTIHGIFFRDANCGVAIGYGGYIGNTDDGGLTWEMLPMWYTQGRTLYDFTFLDENNGYAIGSNNLILSTSDFGRTWEGKEWHKSPFDFRNSDYSFSRISFIDMMTGWIFGWNDNFDDTKSMIIKTEDGGKSWFKLYDTDAFSAFDGYFMNPDTGWVVGSKGDDFYEKCLTIQKTVDGGQTWEEQFFEPGSDYPYVRCFLRRLESDGKGNLWTVGERGLIARSTDPVNHWELQKHVEHTIKFESICFVNATTGWGITEYVVDRIGQWRLIKTTDGGKTWQNQLEDTDIFNVYFIDELHGWATTTNDTASNYHSVGDVILRTANGGLTWQESLLPTWAESIFFLNEDIGWLGSLSSIYKTTDGGKTWSKQFPPEYESYDYDQYYKVDIHFADAMNGLAIGMPFGNEYFKHAIYTTHDGGENWNRTVLDHKVNMSTNGYAGLTAAHMIDENNGWVCGGGWLPTAIHFQSGAVVYRPTLLRTQDGGLTWEHQELNTYIGTLMDMTFTDPDHGYIVANNDFWGSDLWGLESAIIHTSDGGDTWTVEEKYTDFTCLSFVKRQNYGWAAGRWGTLLHYGDGSRINQAPVIISPAQAEAVEDVAFTYIAEARDYDQDVIYFDFFNMPHWMLSNDTEVSGTPRQGDTDTTFTIVASDGELSDTLIVSVSLTPVNDPPVLTSPDSVTAVINEPFTYTARTYNEEKDSVTIWFGTPEFNVEDTSLIWIGNPAWLTVTDSVLTGTPVPGTQDTVVAITLFDDINTVFDTLKITILEQPERPVIYSPDFATAVEDSLFQYVIQATNPNESALTYEFKNYPNWLTPQDSIITGIPREGTQDTCFTAVVSDGVGEDTLKVQLTVLPVNDPPVILSPVNLTAVEDSAFTYTAHATDPEDSVLIFTYFDCPQWLAADGATITGTVPDGADDAQIMLIVSDGELADTADIKIHVTLINEAPVIVSPDTVTAIEDSQFLYLAQAMDPDGTDPWFQFQALPHWLTATDTSVSGIPLEGDCDTSFVVIATDGLLRDTLEVTVQVTPVNDPPEIQPIYNFEFENTETVTFDLDTCATDPDHPDSVQVWTLTCDERAVDIQMADHLVTLSAPEWMGETVLNIKVTDPDGACDSTSVGLTVTGEVSGIASSVLMPETVELHPNYPNPFNPITTIRYGLPNKSEVVLEIYNVRGERMAVLKHGVQNAGYHEAVWQAGEQPSGMYVIRLKAGNVVKNLKCLLLK